MKTTRVMIVALIAVLFVLSGCVSSETKPAQTQPVAKAEQALPPANIQPPAIKVTGELGKVFTGEFKDAINDYYYEYAVEKGAEYLVYVVDGYNNGQNADMKLDSPAKAVGFWILRSDAKTAYPRSVYAETDDDSKSGYGFIGFTLDKAPGPVATVKTQDTILFIHVQRYKASYTGSFMVKVVKK